MLQFRLVLCVISLITVYCAREPPMVTIPAQGTLMGTYKTLFRTQRIIAYLGIPFAQPPIGFRRFAAPDVMDLPRWDGIRNATQMAPGCLQHTGDETKPQKRHDVLFYKLLEKQTEEFSERYFDEDCLYLNVYVPEGMAPVDGFGTMVWIHGGDFVSGSPYDINPFQLVFKQKLIVVTISYRLNIFGFMTTMDGESPGNFGLMDQSAALEWVHHNIELFGGSKDNVCILGHGAGGISVGLHLTSAEWSEKTFQKAIAMSGNSLAPGAVKYPKEKKTLDRVASAFGCFRTPTSALITCLRHVSAQTLLDQGAPLADWGPIIDYGLSNRTRPFVPDYPYILFERGRFEKVPLMLGFTDMEDVLLLNKEDTEDAGITKSEFDTMINDLVIADLAFEEDNSTCFTYQQHLFDSVDFFYNPIPPTSNETILRRLFLDFYTEKVYGAPVYAMAKYASKYSQVFAYRFDLKPLSPAVIEGIPEWVSVPHNFDLVFVWGLPYMANPIEAAQWDSSDKRVSDIVMRLWSNFVVYSNPTNTGVYITWDNFTDEAPGFLIIDRTFNMSGATGLNYRSFEFWNDFYPKVMDIATQCCNDTNSASIINLKLFNIDATTTSITIFIITMSILNLLRI